MDELVLIKWKMAGVYQLNVEIAGIEPPIWRRFKVNESYTLSDLGIVINYMFDWYGIHLSEFRIDNKTYGLIHPEDDMPADLKDSEAVKLRDLSLKTGTKFNYIYDIGDWWEHTITVENYEKGAGLLYPVCSGGARNAPPEDCGGLPGYGVLLEVIKDKNHPQREMFETILDDDWYPEEFDPELLNTLMRDPNLGIIVDPNNENF